MRPVPGWALGSATAAPIVLVGGWTVAAARQPGGFDSVTGTISALAAIGATDRWIMTAGLLGLGVAHLVTAAGLRPAARPGRLLLALGGLGTVAVAAFPQSAAGGSAAHGVAATVAFAALAVWPAFAGSKAARTPDDPPFGRPDDGPVRRPDDRPFGRPGAALLASSFLLVALVGWFAVELGTAGPRTGLAERSAAAAEACCPLLLALLWRRHRDPSTAVGKPALAPSTREPHGRRR